MASRLQGFVVLVFITFVACASVKKPVKRHQAYAKNGTQVNQRHQVRAPNITIESQTATQPKRSRGKHRRHVRTRTIKNASDSEVTEFSEQPVADSVLGAPDAVVSHDANYESDDRVDASRLLVAYCAAFSVVILCVSVMFYALGTAVVLQVVMYVGCLAVVKISLKLVYAHDFYYPKFITALHLFVSSTVGFCLLLNRKATSGQAVVVPTKDELLYGILPIASTFGLSIACDNSALVFASAAFSEVVASTNPVMSFARIRRPLPRSGEQPSYVEAESVAPTWPLDSSSILLCALRAFLNGQAQCVGFTVTPKFVNRPHRQPRSIW